MLVMPSRPFIRVSNISHVMYVVAECYWWLWVPRVSMVYTMPTVPMVDAVPMVPMVDTSRVPMVSWVPMVPWVSMVPL